ncbi:hypothetical protein LV85_02261 [Algoriphagus chordae]|uniref:Uncharacterized protein n=1 Tax=Algoriphagus chordae TaxID=237019 RepID=A0A2W7R657_9BACT|nr:hypothetical protein LV85_02261 [Algoriphagus chordae]
MSVKTFPFGRMNFHKLGNALMIFLVRFSANLQSSSSLIIEIGLWLIVGSLIHRSIGTNGGLLSRDVPMERGIFIYATMLQTNRSYGTVMFRTLSSNTFDDHFLAHPAS